MQTVLAFKEITTLTTVMTHFPNVHLGQHIKDTYAYYYFAINYILPDSKFYDPEYNRLAKKSIKDEEFHTVGKKLQDAKLPYMEKAKRTPAVDQGWLQNEARKCNTIKQLEKIPGKWQMNKTLRELAREIVLSKCREKKRISRINDKRNQYRKLYPWQCAVVRYLMSKERDMQNVYVVSDHRGQHGKSALAQILAMKGFQIVTNTKEMGDMARFVKTDIEQGLWIVDAERAAGRLIQWEFIERLKNGKVTKTKYDGEDEDVHHRNIVVVFTNLRPDEFQYHLSRARLRIITIHGESKERAQIRIIEQGMTPAKDNYITPNYSRIKIDDIYWPPPEYYDVEEESDDDDAEDDYDEANLDPLTPVLLQEVFEDA